MPEFKYTVKRIKDILFRGEGSSPLSPEDKHNRLLKVDINGHNALSYLAKQNNAELLPILLQELSYNVHSLKTAVSHITPYGYSPLESETVVAQVNVEVLAELADTSHTRKDAMRFLTKLSQIIGPSQEKPTELQEKIELAKKFETLFASMSNQSDEENANQLKKLFSN